MTVLVISPDFLSHYNPLSILARAASMAGRRVVVATGSGLRPRVEADGFEWRSLQLGRTSNTGTTVVDPAMRDFLDATAAGPLATIGHQAEQRRRDLLWEPEATIARIGALLDDVDPAITVVDHVSFGSTLALYASGRSSVTMVPGHPSQLPVGAERYGVPATWPAAMKPAEAELAAVEELADRTTRAFTERWNRALAASGSTEPPVADAFRVHGDRVLFNSVAALADPARLAQLPTGHRFVGPLVRSETLPPSLSSVADPSDDGAARPLVYVALGTFLSHRADVLARIAAGLRLAGVRAAIATGATSPAALGPIPADWIVAPTLPQVALLAHADVAIHHGGNNSVQEAIAAGVPQVVLPFSTDQFANAADLERRAGAVVCPPNDAGPDDIAVAIENACGGTGTGAGPLSAEPLTAARLAAELVGTAAGPDVDDVDADRGDPIVAR